MDDMDEDWTVLAGGKKKGGKNPRKASKCGNEGQMKLICAARDYAYTFAHDEET